MNKKSFLAKNRRIIILIFVLIIVAMSQWLVELYFKGASCVRINRSFYSELKKLNNSCQTDQDCKAFPIGIGLCLNKDQDTTKIEQLNRELKECLKKESSDKIFSTEQLKIKKCGCKEGICRAIKSEEKQNQVTITTDKTEYEGGEDVEITLKNNSNENIYLLVTECTGGKWNNFLILKKYDSGIWKNQDFMNYPKPQYFACFNKCIEIKKGEDFDISGNKLQYYDDDKDASFPLSEGKYRFEITAGKQCSKIGHLENTFTIYSNEFEIK